MTPYSSKISFYRLDLTLLCLLVLVVGIYIAQYQQAYPSNMPDLLLKSNTRLDKLSTLSKEITLIHISDGTSQIHLRNIQSLSRFHFQHPKSKIIDVCTELPSLSEQTEAGSLKENFPIYQSKKALEVSQGRLPITFYTDQHLKIHAIHQGELSYTKLLNMTELDR